MGERLAMAWAWADMAYAGASGTAACQTETRVTNSPTVRGSAIPFIVRTTPSDTSRQGCGDTVSYYTYFFTMPFCNVRSIHGLSAVVLLYNPFGVLGSPGMRCAAFIFQISSSFSLTCSASSVVSYIKVRSEFVPACFQVV